MPQMSMPLHPQTLSQLSNLQPIPEPPPNYSSMPRQTGNRAPGINPTIPAYPNLPPGLRAPTIDPNQLGGLRGGGPGGPANPFGGNQNPGAFTTPAPFNPLLAQTIMGMRGGLPGFGGAAGMMPRGPMGSFGLTPENRRPKGANPYR